MSLIFGYVDVSVDVWDPDEDCLVSVSVTTDDC